MTDSTAATTNLFDYLPTVSAVAKRWGAAVTPVRALAQPVRILVVYGDFEIEVEFNAAGELTVDGETGDLEETLASALDLANQETLAADHWYEDDERELAEMDF